MKNPLLTLVPSENKYELARDCNILVTIGNQDYDIWVPEGFIYDGASIPSYFWDAVYTPFTPKVMRGALVHDWLYYTHHVQKEPVSRKIADDIFKKALVEDGIESLKATMIYLAVRFWGRFHWENTLENKITLQKLGKEKGDEAWKFGLIPPY
jgi:Protein of unknown function (DUF1353)